MAPASGILGGLRGAGGDAGQSRRIVEGGSLPHDRLHLRSDCRGPAHAHVRQRAGGRRHRCSFCWRLSSDISLPLHPAFSAAGFTAAIILVFGGQGRAVAHGMAARALHDRRELSSPSRVGALIWPVRARAGLAPEDSQIFSTAPAALYRAVTAAALEGDRQRATGSRIRPPSCTTCAAASPSKWTKPAASCPFRALIRAHTAVCRHGGSGSPPPDRDGRGSLALHPRAGRARSFCRRCPR